jgi:hypothetical protein
VEQWIEWVFGLGFHLFSAFCVVSHSFIVSCFRLLGGICFRGYFCTVWITGRILTIRDDDKEEKVNWGKRRRMGEEENRVLPTRWLGRS